MSRLQTSYFSSEFLASGLSTEFYDFITRVTQAKSKTEESSHATEELAKLRSKMGSPDVSSTKMRDYLIRLIHCYMLGYKVDFSIIYAIMASQSGETAGDKRVGYLACTLFLKNDNELGIMLINTLQRDLKSQGYLDKCNALNAICNLDHTQDMVDSILDLVIQAMDFPKQIVRKKAVMTLYFLYEKSSITIERIEGALREALDDKDSSVVFAALSVWKMILGDHAEKFKDLQSTIYAVHKQILEKRVHKSFLYHGVLAPWAQMDCLSIYKIYHNMNIGSPKDLYNMIMECLEAMEKKVDAAFAIVLDCIKLLSDIDPILVGSFSSTSDLKDQNPFDKILSGYLNANNHNLKYLGLVGISHVDLSFWKEEWLDGTLLGEVMRTSYDDDTIITQTIENLDTIITLDENSEAVLSNVSPGMIEALSRNKDMKTCNTTIAYWLINRIVEYSTINSWFIETIIGVLAETRKNLNDDYVETQCSSLKEILLEEVDNTSLRESSVNTVYQLLKKTNSEHFSPIFIQFAFWTLGENGYLSSTYSETDIMRQLQKWVAIIQDDYLQACGLQAIKRCILRSKTWLSELEKILKEYKKSPVPEKQEISRELLIILADVDFEKQLQETDLTLSSSFTKMSMNPNRPKGVGKFMNNHGRINISSILPEEENDDLPTFSRDTYNDMMDSNTINSQSNHYNNLTAQLQWNHSNSNSLTQQQGSKIIVTEPQRDLVSSLLDFELNEENIMTTEEFGTLWVQYTIEKKKRIGCTPITKCEKLAKRLSKAWRIQVIQVIGQEFIAISSKPELMLIHVTLLTHNQFQLTIKAKYNHEITSFLKERQLL